ncbi:MAG: ribosomal-processing cysteine protease Prp [Lachnospiraceae bacterium]|jgi:uncharacterized protein YsxB (DUF464 family)|nr:ribosomal-processing cysteine protease Prp [Lachnospiraceae bacterium]
MIQVTITLNQDKEYHSLSCIGHAGYAKKQKDIVCAAVSVLVINTLNVLEELAGEKMIFNQQDSGYLVATFTGKLQEKSIFLLDAMVYGLKQIRDTYGAKHLQIRYEEVPR